jgi:hypothetical protein
MAQWQIADKIGWLQDACAQRDSINPMATMNTNLVIEGPQPRGLRPQALLNRDFVAYKLLMLNRTRSRGIAAPN